MKMDGGVDAVRVVPIRMQSGGDPAEKLLAEGPPEGPTKDGSGFKSLVKPLLNIPIVYGIP